MSDSTETFERLAQRSGPNPEPPKLTKRQREVLALVALGATYEEIGVKLGFTASASKQHIQILRKKFGVKHKRDLIGVAHRHGLVP